MTVRDTERIGGIQFLRHLLFGDMQEPLQHPRYLLFGRMAVTGDCHLDLHRRILIHGHILAQRCRDCYTLCMYNLDHRLRVLVHKLGLDRQTRRLILVDDLLQKEELLLKPRVLPLEFMHIVRAELQYFHLLPDRLQNGITHKQRTRVHTQDDMFASYRIDHRIDDLVSLMVTDKAANHDDDGTGDQHVVAPRLQFRHTQTCTYSQDYQADD